MNEIKEYTVLMAVGTSAISDEVKEHIQQGWQPMGGVSVTITLESYPALGENVTAAVTRYYQAMVR